MTLVCVAFVSATGEKMARPPEVSLTVGYGCQSDLYLYSWNRGEFTYLKYLDHQS